MTSSSARPIGRAGTSHPATIRAARSVVRKERAMPSSPPDDARRIFSGIGATYERAGALLSFGQDARWRARLVDSVRAAPGDVVLDVATGTGLVARAVSERYGCEVVGLDPSGDMLSAAVARNGHIPLVRARAESLPFPDESFDHLTFTYLLRYVDDPAATMRELARVVRPGGSIVALDFGVPTNPILRMLWRVHTSIGLPTIGRAISPQWASVGAFLKGSIERFNAAHPQHTLERHWREAGLVDVQVAQMSFGAGVVMTGVKDGATEEASLHGAGTTETLSTRRGPPGPGSQGRRPIARGPSVVPAPAFYALAPGGCIGSDAGSADCRRRSDRVFLGRRRRVARIRRASRKASRHSDSVERSPRIRFACAHRRGRARYRRRGDARSVVSCHRRNWRASRGLLRARNSDRAFGHRIRARVGRIPGPRECRGQRCGATADDRGGGRGNASFAGSAAALHPGPADPPQSPRGVGNRTFPRRHDRAPRSRSAHRGS
ncbi:MAG: methyltransferase domain-containing protein [Chloroflexi bacterium]|nr:MAG: methyltransferase domain-containing protein [Chloroflexota bacterium]